MKLTIKATLYAGMLAISGAALPVSAAETLHVNVPFSFVVNGTKMEAGDYSITPAGNNGVVTVAGAKNSVMVLTVPSEYSKDTGLSFTSNDNTSVLTGIKLSGTVAREIPVRAVAEHKVALVSAR